MPLIRNVIAVILIFLFAAAAFADTKSVKNGTDTFFAGTNIKEAINTSGDTFLVSRTLDAHGTSQGDLHISGFDVSVEASTQQDLYAVGATVAIGGSVGEDLTAAGFSVHTTQTSLTSGNARLIGRSVIIDGAVSGALMATAQDVVLNAPISGDARIFAQSFSFGPQAKIDGVLTYSSESTIDIPDYVISSDRVIFEEATSGSVWEEIEEVGRHMPVFPTFASLFFGFLVSLLFFLALGALMLGFMPNRLERMRQTVASSPGRTFLSGIIGLSILFGLVPITALTIIGLPFVPIAVLLIVVLWTLGYALGAYSVAMPLWMQFGGDEDPSTLTRLTIYAIAIVCIAILNFIPFVGWVVNYTLVLLGIGAMTNLFFQYLIVNPSPTLDVDMNRIKD